MDEEIVIIDSNTRNEKIKNFFINNKKKIITFFLVLLFLLISYFILGEIKERKKLGLANKFNTTIINFDKSKKDTTIDNLRDIIKESDNTYSPLALYFLLDNNLIDSKEEINNLFDVLIHKTKLEKEIKNLIIYKKAIFNSNHVKENDLIQMLNPIINSESIWKSHALYLVAEYFYSQNQKQKAKEFFDKILLIPNSNEDIKMKSQKRINRDF